MTENGGKVVTVKNWHVILTLVSWLVLSVAQFVAVSKGTEQNTRDIEEMKRDHVSKDRYDESQQDILRRLQRIEDKLDRERALRSLRP